VQVDMGRPDLDRRAGSRTGAYASALGHAVLAWHDPVQARQVLASAERVRLSERTLVDLDALMARLATVRRLGYAISDGENAYGLRTIAAPVLDADGRPIAGVSLSVRNERIELDAFVADALPLLLRTTEALTRAAHLTASAR
jgi:IclR family pca regulon transcriptional regulator